MFLNFSAIVADAFNAIEPLALKDRSYPNPICYEWDRVEVNIDGRRSRRKPRRMWLADVDEWLGLLGETSYEECIEQDFEQQLIHLPATSGNLRQRWKHAMMMMMMTWKTQSTFRQQALAYLMSSENASNFKHPWRRKTQILISFQSMALQPTLRSLWNKKFRRSINPEIY